MSFRVTGRNAYWSSRNLCLCRSLLCRPHKNPERTMRFANCVGNAVRGTRVKIEAFLCDDLAKRWRIVSGGIGTIEEKKEEACSLEVTMTTTKTTTRVKSEYLAWAKVKQKLLRELSVNLIESTETHLQLSVKGAKLQILIPSTYQFLTTTLSSTTPPPPDSDEVFLVVTVGAVDSRLDSSILALNEKLERIVVAQDALHEVLDLLLAVVTSLGQGKRKDGPEELRRVKHVNSDDVNANCEDEEKYSNKSCESDDNSNGSEFADDDDEFDHHNDDDDADYTASGYDIAMGETAMASSNAEVESRARGLLHALAETARKECEEAQTGFRGQEDNLLMWCRVISNPASLKIQLQFELAGILGDHIAAGLNLSLDDPVTLHLSFDRAVWCESIFRLQKPIDYGQIQATQPHRTDVNVIAVTQTATPTETEPHAIDVFLDKETERARGRDHRSYGLEILFPELTVRFFQALNSSRESTITSSRRRREPVSSPSSSSPVQLETLNCYIREPNPILGLAKFISHQLRLLPNWCLVCWQTLPSCVTRMRTCDRDLCLYRFEELGLGAAVLQEVKLSAELVDLELSLANAAICAPRDVFEPFPAFLLTKDGVRGRSGWFSSANASGQHRDRATSMANRENKNTQLLQAVLTSIPPISTLQQCATEKELKRVLMRAWYVSSYLGALDTPHGSPIEPSQPALPHENSGSQYVWRPKPKPVEEWRKQRGLAYDVMRFVLTSNRLSLRLLGPEEQVLGCDNTIFQFVMLHDSPEREAHFTKRRAQAGGSFFAFHGSAAENWYSILRNGLRSMSNTTYMSTGAAYGEGIYFGGNISTSFQYAKAAALSWDKGCLKEGFQVVAICEIVNECTRHNAADHSSRNIIVVPREHEHDVAIRYLLVFRQSPNSFLIRGDHNIEGCILGNKLNLSAHYQQLRGDYERSQQEQKQSRMSARYEVLRAIAEENRCNEKTTSRIPPTLKRKAELCEERPLHPQPQQLRSGKQVDGQSISIRAVMKEYNALTKAIAKSPPISTFIQLSENATVLSGVAIDINESDLSMWRVSLHPYLFKQCPPLYNDLSDLKRMRNMQDDVHVILEVKFPPNYPFEPPFVRVLSPRFIMHSGHVTIGGSICMELLTASGWSPACSFESLLVQVVMAFVEGHGRIDINGSIHGRDYQESEAREAFLRAARTHGWKT